MPNPTLRRNRHSAGSGRALRLALAIVVLAFPAALSHAAGPSGADIVDTVCAGCHERGEGGATRIGDRTAWARLAEQGLAALTRRALEGVRNMPAHGGNDALSNDDLKRAIVYMVNRSGGNWVEPDSTRARLGERSGREVAERQCAQCHGAGLAGAPRIGDRTEWARRLRLGIDLAVRSAVRGHGGMPPRGGLPTLTDAEIRHAIVYMASARAPARAGDAGGSR